jgi:hypothetical protein
VLSILYEKAGQKLKLSVGREGKICNANKKKKQYGHSYFFFLSDT